MRKGKRLGNEEVIIDNYFFKIIKITNAGNLLLRPIGKIDVPKENELIIAEEEKKDG